MPITVEVIDGIGWSDRAPFEVMPRAGEVIHWPVEQNIVMLRVIGVSYFPGQSDFQAQLHVEKI